MKKNYYYYYKIYQYCPKELIFEGEMTFPEAHRFCDEHATSERRVSYEVFNDIMNRWEKYGDTYHGGRKVYDKKGELYILDPDYRNMWKPEAQRYHLWRFNPDGSYLFVQSFATEEKANKRRDFLQEGQRDWLYRVLTSDIDITKL